MQDNPLGGRASSFGLFRGSIGIKRPSSSSRMSVGSANNLWKATDPTDQFSKSPEASSEPPAVRVIEMTDILANGNTKVVENPLLNARRSVSEKALQQAAR